jgi:DNA (cytosine-5)-methyltransferase 1
MFRPPLGARCHRVFEASFLLLAPGPCCHGVWTERLYPGGRSQERGGDYRTPVRFTVEIGARDIPLPVQQRAVGIDWMTLGELSGAVPPVYTEWVGRRLLSVVEGGGDQKGG